MKPEATAPSASPPSSGMVRCPRCGAHVPSFYLTRHGCQDCSRPHRRRFNDGPSTSSGNEVGAVVGPAVFARIRPNSRPALQRRCLGAVDS